MEELEVIVGWCARRKVFALRAVAAACICVCFRICVVVVVVVVVVVRGTGVKHATKRNAPAPKANTTSKQGRTRGTEEARSGVRITRGNEKRAAFFPVAPACRPAAHARARFRGRRGKGGEGRRSKQESGCSRFCFPTLYFCGSGKKTREGGEEEGGLSFERRRWGAMRASSCFVSALLLPCVCLFVLSLLH